MTAQLTNAAPQSWDLLMRQVWPLALMLCADRVPIVRMHFKCVDPSGFSRSPERPYLHYVVVPSPIR